MFDTVVNNGGEAITDKADSKAVDAPVVKGIGDCMLYLVDRYGDKGSMYDATTCRCRAPTRTRRASA